MRFDTGGPSLSLLKQRAKAKVDTEAEAARNAFITPGSGQALEYMKAEAEARAYKTAGYPTPFNPDAYPMIYAEMLAQADVGAVNLNTQTTINAAAVTVTDTIIREADDWMVGSRQIRRLRRSAKAAIDAATTAAQIYDASIVVWPIPGVMTGARLRATTSVIWGAASVTPLALTRFVTMLKNPVTGGGRGPNRILISNRSTLSTLWGTATGS